MDISNGEEIGVSIFVQGCHFHCKNCFNQSTWDFNGGKEWTEDTKKDFLELASRPQIRRISILGGEPLAEENLKDVLNLINEIRLSFPEKSIWLYSGYYWEEIFEPSFAEQSEAWIQKYLEASETRKQIISMCDIMVDGRFVDELKDLSLSWRGSANQRVIDIKESLRNKKVTMYCN